MKVFLQEFWKMVGKYDYYSLLQNCFLHIFTFFMFFRIVLRTFANSRRKADFWHMKCVRLYFERLWTLFCNSLALLLQKSWKYSYLGMSQNISLLGNCFSPVFTFCEFFFCLFQDNRLTEEKNLIFDV